MELKLKPEKTKILNKPFLYGHVLHQCTTPKRGKYRLYQMHILFLYLIGFIGRIYLFLLFYSASKDTMLLLKRD